MGRPSEPLKAIPPTGNAGLATGRVFLYGLDTFRDLMTPRQLATTAALAASVRNIHETALSDGLAEDRAKALSTCLGLILDRVILRSNNNCLWDTGNLSVTNAFGRQVIVMVWDFAETNPFGAGAGQVIEYVHNVADIVESLARVGLPVDLHRGSATSLPYPNEHFDAVITDPPYYDNISYANLSDFFYVWLKRSLGFLYPEELGGEVTPKRREIIYAPYRHENSGEASGFFEREMTRAFMEAHRVLKPGAPLVCVYAHKTTLGWSTLVEALRRAGFRITEAWPLDTELISALKNRVASLASSIFLVARRRDSQDVGDYGEVLDELDQVIERQLNRLIDAGVSGSDLVIATIGAGLQPFTRFRSVELANGEPMPADRFLEEVQTKVLGAILHKVHGLGDGVGGPDSATRYYVLARYSYGYADVDFDEANNLARTTGLELDNGLTSGHVPLAKIQQRKVHLLEFTERGEDLELGLTGGRRGRER